MIFESGLPETPCGAGSTMVNTAELRAALPGLLRDLKCKVLVDAPCGDLNWMSQVDLSGIRYVGIDVAERIEDARARAAALRADDVRLEVRDIVRSALAPADVVLCRDFLQHLPNVMVDAVLRNIFASGADWLLVTSHNVPRNADLDTVGGFRPLNLRLPPFSFFPSAVIKDCGRELLVVPGHALAMEVAA
ncbi:MAG: class I SAM-dependent methyltransferase [Bradyrhizobium sp.]|uniref:class I SAM-dependent methyltransferase n=1 Tax=Bradyrhizobium sp. TaxID=376 RepID=UPI0029A9DBA6|nr:class I SAM-dependent methyltransferase [Bradyrhizobium sp.]MDX3971160.1 class I SAM-dependent methyltransferase [Bradyrhizobium sp.]